MPFALPKRFVTLGGLLIIGPVVLVGIAFLVPIHPPRSFPAPSSAPYNDEIGQMDAEWEAVKLVHLQRPGFKHIGGSVRSQFKAGEDQSSKVNKLPMWRISGDMEDNGRKHHWETIIGCERGRFVPLHLWFDGVTIWMEDRWATLSSDD
jgi:hypothetical protein